MTITDKLIMLFVIWGVGFVLFNPFFENKYKRVAAAFCFFAASICFLFT